ncbi:hypothetical protein CTheo_9009 [Ceratobasidium theobromae]|uniref:Uncharacterized protein n=1 Tax=Ceratobasidium theobromae TaxID=1582974 RepID=A0A5N5Q6U8_9AGAM|nr:hypothetical protein CTheo_9009 [Ceratobasidium theobromae]
MPTPITIPTMDPVPALNPAPQFVSKSDTHVAWEHDNSSLAPLAQAPPSVCTHVATILFPGGIADIRPTVEDSKELDLWITISHPVKRGQFQLLINSFGAKYLVAILMRQ